MSDRCIKYEQKYPKNDKNIQKIPKKSQKNT